MSIQYVNCKIQIHITTIGRYSKILIQDAGIIPEYQQADLASLKNMIRLLCDKMKKVNKQCLLDTPRTVRFSEKTLQV